LITISTTFAISNQLENISYLLRDSFILDSGAIIYIYNNSIRFINLEPSNQLLFVRTNIADIQDFGDINIIILTLDGKKCYFLLKKILYISRDFILILFYSRSCLRQVFDRILRD
jgi:hypothetical protein